MTSTWEILELAERMGLKGAEFRKWYDERMEREREERAAERKAKTEKLELELRARKEQLERVTREKKELLEREAREKKHQLELERRALERQLEFVMARKTPVERENCEHVLYVSHGEQVVDTGSKNSSGQSEFDYFGEVDPEPRESLSLQPAAQVEEYLDMGSREPVKNVVELDEAEQSFGSREQRSSVQNNVCLGTSQRPSIFQEEVGLPLDSSIEGALERHWCDDGECREESSEVMAAVDCLALDTVTGATSMVEVDANNSLVNRESSSPLVNCEVTSPSEQGESTESVVQADSTESEVFSSAGAGVEGQNTKKEKFESVQLRADSIEDEVDGGRVPVRNVLRSDEGHVYSVTSSGTESTVCEMSDELTVYKPSQRVGSPEWCTRTLSTPCALRGRRQLDFNLSSAEVGRAAVRPSSYMQMHKQASGQHCFQASRFLGCMRKKLASRLVWDAIT